LTELTLGLSDIKGEIYDMNTKVCRYRIYLLDWFNPVLCCQQCYMCL